MTRWLFFTPRTINICPHRCCLAEAFYVGRNGSRQCRSYLSSSLHSFIDDWNVSVRDADGHTTSVTNLRIRRQHCRTTCQLTVTRHLFSYLLDLPTQATPRVCVQGTQLGSTSCQHGSQRRRDGQNQPLRPWRRGVLMQRRENGRPSSLALRYIPHFFYLFFFRHR